MTNKLKLTGSNLDCEFCGEKQHYGICEPMREAQERASREGLPVVNPRVRN